MNINDLVDEVADGGAVSRDFVEVMIKRIAAAIIKTVTKGESVHIRGFGRFRSYKMAARMRRHPKTGKEYVCPATTSVRFAPSVVFRTAVAARKTAPG